MIHSHKISSESDRQAREFQTQFIRDAITKIGTQEKLAKALCVTQQTISKYKDGTNILALSKMVRIAKLMGDKQINVTWT